MAVYKFKIFIEDNEDIYREIEILSTQTFEELHNAIQDAYKFDRKHAAAFFVSDDYWRKEQEITLLKENLELDADEIKNNVAPKKLMSQTKVAKFIDSPRQRFLYVFDPNVKWTFCLELMKILTENPKTNYPVIVKSIGNPPKQYKQTIIAKEELSPDLMMASLLNDPEIEESEIYQAIKSETNGIDEGDLNHLEGEEGEHEDELEVGDDHDESEDDEPFIDMEESDEH